MSDFRVTESYDGGELVLGGSLTIENASTLRTTFIKALMKEDDLSVCIDADAIVDVSSLQLLCSAHRTALKLGKSITLRLLDKANFLGAVDNAGYIRRRGCARDKDGTCLLVGGAHE